MWYPKLYFSVSHIFNADTLFKKLITHFAMYGTPNNISLEVGHIFFADTLFQNLTVQRLWFLAFVTTDCESPSILKDWKGVVIFLPCQHSFLCDLQ